MKDGYSILPRGFSLDGYRSIFLFPKQIAKAYGISIFVTGAGTCIGSVSYTHLDVYKRQVVGNLGAKDFEKVPGSQI